MSSWRELKHPKPLNLFCWVPLMRVSNVIAFYPTTVSGAGRSPTPPPPEHCPVQLILEQGAGGHTKLEDWRPLA